MTDKEIKNKFNIPHSTLWRWKKENCNYKNKIYHFLRALTIEECENILERLKKKNENSI